MNSRLQKVPNGPDEHAARLFSSLRFLLDRLGFGDQLRQRNGQPFRQLFRHIQSRIAQAPLQHSHISRMQIRPFGQLFLRQRFSLPVPPEHQGKRIRHFQAPHSRQHGQKDSHRTQTVVLIARLEFRRFTLDEQQAKLTMNPRTFRKLNESYEDCNSRN